MQGYLVCQVGNHNISRRDARCLSTLQPSLKHRLGLCRLVDEGKQFGTLSTPHVLMLERRVNEMQATAEKEQRQPGGADLLFVVYPSN